MQGLHKFKETIIDISTETKKFQKVGIHEIKKHTTREVTFFHFEVGFIYADQEQLETYDLKNNEFEEITIDGNKYRHVRLHFSIVPSKKLIILDNRCYSTATKKLLTHLIEPLIDGTSFNNDTKDPTGLLRLNIVPIAKDDFEQELNRQFRNLKEVNLIMGKPSKLKLSALPDDLDKEAELDKLKELTQSVISSLFEIDPSTLTYDSLPIKSLKISVQIDDEIGNAGSRTQMKANLKKFLKDYRHNLYTDNLSFRYKDQGEVVQALLNSAKLTRPIDVDPFDYDKSEKMWTQQRTSYFDLVDKKVFD